MPGEISVLEVPPYPLAAVRVRTNLSTWPQEFRGPLDRVYAALAASQVKHTGLNVMVYRPRPKSLTDSLTGGLTGSLTVGLADPLTDIECGVGVVARFADLGEVVCCETPQGLAVTTTHLGPYTRLQTSHGAIVEWSRRNGRLLSGICWEVYGHWNDDPARLQTQLYHLIAR